MVVADARVRVQHQVRDVDLAVREGVVVDLGHMKPLPVFGHPALVASESCEMFFKVWIIRPTNIVCTLKFANKMSKVVTIVRSSDNCQKVVTILMSSDNCQDCDNCQKL